MTLQLVTNVRGALDLAVKGLHEISAELAVQVLTHVEQRRNVNAVRELLAHVDQARSAADLHDAQIRLLAYSARAQRAHSGIARNIKRLRIGNSPEWPPLGVSFKDSLPQEIGPRWILSCPEESRDLGEWEVELHVARRVVRQLKCVGDALAWRAFDFRRCRIVALSRNSSSGLFVGKEGFGAELAMMQEIHERRGNFVLLNDLTFSIRMADLTEVMGDDLQQLYEVKKKQRAHARSQEMMANAAIESIDGGSPLPQFEDDRDAHYLRSTGVAFRSHVAEIQELVAETEAGSGFSLNTRQGRLVSVTDVISLIEDRGCNTDALLRAKVEAVQRNYAGEHVMSASSLDYSARVPGHAPFSIYPWTADRRARLICDYLTIDVLTSAERISVLFEEAGFEPRVVINRAATARESYVMAMTAGPATLMLDRSAVAQLCLEFIDNDAFVASVQALIAGGIRGGQHTLVYEGEAAVWAKR